MFEAVTENHWPWAQKNPASEGYVYYGRCPACGNAMQLINITSPTSNKRRPHGRHKVKKVPGFAYSLDDILNCDEFSGKVQSSDVQSLSELSPEADRLRRFIPAHFALMIGLLREDTGLILTVAMASDILKGFLGSRRYCWWTLSPDNIPWTFAATGKTYSMLNQAVKPDSALASEIAKNAKSTHLNEKGWIKARPSQNPQLFFGFRAHTFEAAGHDDAAQTILFYVDDLSEYDGDPSDIRPVYRQTINLRLNALKQRAQHQSQGTRTTSYQERLTKAANSLLEHHLRSEGGGL